jgi:hypothetical protein
VYSYQKDSATTSKVKARLWEQIGRAEEQSRSAKTAPKNRVGPNGIMRGPKPKPKPKDLLPPELAKIKCMSPEQFGRLFTKYAAMCRMELETVVDDPATPMIDLTIAAAMVAAAKYGEFGKIQWMIERVIGKSGSIPLAESEEMKEQKTLAKLSDQELLDLTKQTILQLEGNLNEHS